MILLSNGLTYIDETYRSDRLGQKPTFLFSECLDLLTPGGAVAFVCVCLRFRKLADLKQRVCFFFHFFWFFRILGSKYTLYQSVQVGSLIQHIL